MEVVLSKETSRKVASGNGFYGDPVSANLKPVGELVDDGRPQDSVQNATTCRSGIPGVGDIAMDSRNDQGACLNSPNSMERVPLKATSPGIFVFSRARQLLYVNRRAMELTGLLGQAETVPVGFVPSASVSELHADVQEALNRRIELGLWKQFEISRSACELGRKLLLRGFGLPNAESVDRSRIVIVLEEILDVYRKDMTAQDKEQPSPAPFAEPIV